MLLIKRDLHAFMFDVSVECLDDAVPVKEDVAISRMVATFMANLPHEEGED